MSIYFKGGVNSYTKISQPFYKAGDWNWLRLKKVYSKIASGWVEVWPMQIVYTHYDYGYNLNIHQLFGSPTTPGNFIFINKGYIGGTRDAGNHNFALDTGYFPAGSKLTIINEGYISGAGGRGATFLNWNDTIDHAKAATSALILRYPAVVKNAAGIIQGGGGGGGATADVGGDHHYNITGGGGAGLPGGLPGSNGYWDTHIASPGTLTEGGLTGWIKGDYMNNGRGGMPGEQGLPEWRIVPDDIARMTIGSPPGIAIHYYGNILAGSDGLTSDRVKGPIVYGTPGAPMASFASFEGNGNVGKELIINLILDGNPEVTASFSGLQTATSYTATPTVGDTSMITLVKDSNSRFRLNGSVMQRTGNAFLQGMRNTPVRVWGWITFTATNANGSNTFSMFFRVGRDAYYTYTPPPPDPNYVESPG